jgi:hypothetical protein
MRVLVALLLLLARPVMAQPADCAPTPVPGPGGPASVVPMAIDLAGRPGVSKGVRGQAYVNVPVGVAAGNACSDDPPPPPHDILHGDPGDVLGGPPSPDLLRGPGHPHVEVELR